jgi:hypothetical protein
MVRKAKQMTLPVGHTYAVPQKYAHIDFKPPKGAQEAAARALRRRALAPPSQRGMTPVGLARARDLSSGRNMSPETVRRMLAYFTRHEVDKQGSTWDDYGPGRQAWDGWGGDAGYSWARKVVGQMNAADDQTKTLRAYGEAMQMAGAPIGDVTDGLTLGRPFKTLALGSVSARLSGETIGEVDLALLEEMVRVYRERREDDPVIIDWQHASSPFNPGPPAAPDVGGALGLIVDLELREDGLYATPAYNERGLKVVQDAGGVLWSSPEYVTGDIFSRDGGSKVGSAQLLAITLTPRPAQSSTKIDRVTLKENLQMDNMDNMSPEELKAALAAKDAMVKELEQKIADMQADAEASLSAEMPEGEMPKSEEEKPAVIVVDGEKPDDEKKMGEYKKMSESLLSEINTLRSTNKQLSEKLAKIEGEKNAAERREAVAALLREGKVAPAEQAAVEAAWDARNAQPVFWKMFSERPANSAVPLSQIGHGASGQELNHANLAEQVKALATEKHISFSEALNLFRTTNPDQYLAVYGTK